MESLTGNVDLCFSACLLLIPENLLCIPVLWVFLTSAGYQLIDGFCSEFSRGCLSPLPEFLLSFSHEAFPYC